LTAADVDELARAQRVQDLTTAAVLRDPRAEHDRLAEPDLEFRAFCARRRLPASSTPQLERAWGTHGRLSDTSAAKLTNGPAAPATRSGYADDHPVPPRTPGQFRKLDAVAVPTARLLPGTPVEIGAAGFVLGVLAALAQRQLRPRPSHPDPCSPGDAGHDQR
jgi:hypothetical protein